MSENKLEKLFSEVLESWLALTLIASDISESEETRAKAAAGANVLNDILQNCGFVADANDFFLERQQLKIRSVIGEPA